MDAIIIIGAKPKLTHTHTHILTRPENQFHPKSTNMAKKTAEPKNGIKSTLLRQAVNNLSLK